MAQDTLSQILADYDLESMRDRLNQACGTNKVLTLEELQDIRSFMERVAHVQAQIEEIADQNTGRGNDSLATIPGFVTLKARKHGRLWYVVDCSTDKEIGGFHTSYGAACFYADMWYRRQYN